MRKKIEILPLDSLKESFIVRVTLSTDNVTRLKDLISAGADVGHLLVSEDDNEIIDGRHRRAAYAELGYKKVSCEVRKFASKTEKILAALQCNMGGALPPTHADINHTIRVLLSEGQSRREIISDLSDKLGFPKKMIQAQVDEVQSNLVKARLNSAVSAVTRGETVHQAAERYQVNLETLQKKLSPAEEENGRPSLNVLKSHFSQECTSFSRTIASNMTRVVRDIGDGLLSDEEVEDLKNHLEKLHKRSNECMANWILRLEKHCETATKSVRKSVRGAKSDVNQGSRGLERMGLV